MAKRRKKQETTEDIIQETQTAAAAEQAQLPAAPPSSTIVIEGEGPISRAVIPVPEAGGLVVLMGRNGAGKTRALNAIRGLWDKDARKKLAPSDGIPSGKVEGLGVTIRLGRNNTSRGELVCEELIGDVDLTSLIDPGLKDPIAADTRRLIVLVRLAGVKVAMDKWASALGYAVDHAPVDFREAVTSDAVQTADRLRRAFHEVALEKEKRAAEDLAEAQNIRQTVAGVAENVLMPNEEALRQRFEVVTAKLAECEAARTAHAKALAAREEASQKLRMLTDELVSVEHAKDKLAAARDLEQTKQEQREQLRLQYLAAQEAARTATAEREKAEQLLASATKQEARRAELQAALDSSLPVIVDDAKLAQIRQDKEDAAEAMQFARLAIHALEVRKRAAALKDRAQQAEREAKRLREAAYATNTVLEEALVESGFTDVKVHDGRICMQTDRGIEPISDLSEGERTRWAFEMLAKGMPEGAIVTLEQEAFESLDPANRKAVYQLAVEKRMAVYTALASEGDLRVGLFSPADPYMLDAGPAPEQPPAGAE